MGYLSKSVVKEHGVRTSEVLIVLPLWPKDLISALAGSEIRSAVEAVHLWVNTVFQAIILIGHSGQNL